MKKKYVRGETVAFFLHVVFAQWTQFITALAVLVMRATVVSSSSFFQRGTQMKALLESVYEKLVEVNSNPGGMGRK
jgi:hypothetical protein